MYVWQFTSPFAYAILCLTSSIHHLVAYENKGVSSMLWLKRDLTVQLATCALTALSTTYGVYGACFIAWLLWSHKFIDLNIDKHRFVAYGLNGISIMISTGQISIIHLHWIASFSLFGVGFLYPNDYTHALFHVYNHLNMSMVWNTFVEYQQSDINLTKKN